MLEAKLFSSAEFTLVIDCAVELPEKKKILVSSPGTSNDLFINQVLVDGEMRRPEVFHNITRRNYKEKIK